MKIKLIVKTNSKNYPIFIGKHLLKDVKNIFKVEKINFEKCLIVADKNVPKKNLFILKRNIKCKKIIIHTFDATEKNKNLKSVNKILDRLLKNNFSRNDCLVSLGGGITGDISGFAASIFKRGIKFVNVATTLLSMVDSSVGGKQGYNTDDGKNLIGSFYQPDCVISDINLLNSLPKREIICGYGEILKHSIISSKKKFIFLDKYKSKILSLKSPYIEKTILESCKIKKNIVQQDEKERNLRKVLNLGHTFAHAYEATLNYSKKLNHGEAVIFGIKTAAKFSYEENLLSKKKFNLISSHIDNLDINQRFKNIINKKNLKKILKFMKSDKKNKSKYINLILIKDIGKPIINYNFKILKIKNFFEKNYSIDI